MSSDLTLLTLPELAKIHILKQLDYPSIQRLRKTCRDFLNLIDDTKLDFHVEEVYLLFSSTTFVFVTEFSSGQTLSLDYSDTCKIKKDTKETLVAGENFHDVFWRDFELFAQQHSIKTLDFMVNEQTSGWKLPSKIRVERVNIRWCIDNNIVDIIRVLDEKFIKSIYIYMDKQATFRGIDEIVKLPQWKKAKTVSIFNGFVDNNIDNFAHFSDVTVIVEIFGLEDVLKIRSWFFSKNPSMTCFRLNFHNNDQYEMITFNRIKKLLTDQIGPQETDDSGKKLYALWISEIPNSTKFLQMRLLDDKLIFKRLDSKSQSDIGGY